MDKEHIYEPLKTYKNVLAPKHEENVNAYFNELVEASGVDISANKSTIKKLRKADSQFKDIKKTIANFNLLKVFMIVVAIILFIMPFIHYNSATFEFSGLNILIVILEILVGGLLLFLVFSKVSPKIKKLKADKAILRDEITKLTEEARIQMEPLNNLFTEGMALELFKKTLPLINFDSYFNSARLDYLVSKFGLNDVPSLNRSTLFVKSGELSGNPFYIANDLVHEMGTKTYTGSITISWTVYTTVNGKRVASTRTQVLTASVTKPYPYYSEQSYLVYGNEAAPDLIFQREDSDAEHLDQKQIDRLVKRETKRLKRKQRKATKKGGSFTQLGHSEFEVLFGATNRNNEVQFRLLFTPLAQKQLLDLMKDKTIGYGDNFDFDKYGKINIIYPEHLNMIDLDVKPSYFYNIDFEIIKEKFLSYNKNYFKSIYFAFAPILSIPLYQQHKPHEYIYKDLYDSYASFYEHESILNKLGEDKFKHPNSQTKNILKAKTIKSGNNTDKVLVTAYGYETKQHVDFIPKLGGDGRMHTVPVHWTEYIPVSETTTVDINVIEEEKNLNYRDHLESFVKRLKSGTDVKEEDLIIINRFITYINKK